jgi:hypothetical protein
MGRILYFIGDRMPCHNPIIDNEFRSDNVRFMNDADIDKVVFCVANETVEEVVIMISRQSNFDMARLVGIIRPVEVNSRVIPVYNDRLGKHIDIDFDILRFDISDVRERAWEYFNSEKDV